MRDPVPSIFREKVKPGYIWLTSCELSTNNLAVVSLICGGASDPIRISTRLGNKNANFDRIEKQLLKSRYLRFMPCFCSQHKLLRYFNWMTKRSGLKMNLTSSWVNNHYFFHFRHITIFFIENNPEKFFISWKYLVFPKIITVVIKVLTWLRTRNLSQVKLRYSELATKIWPIFHL